MPSNAFLGVFAKSPIKPIEEHIKIVHKASSTLVPFFNHVFKSEWTEAETLRLEIRNLERIGDEAERIARVALDSFTKDQQDLLVNLENMGRQVSKMLHDVLDAFARMDAQSAFEVHKEDAKVDREYEALTRQIMTYMMEDPRSIPKIMDLIWSVRSLERIGDRCQNIAEYVIYFVNGKDIRHTSQEDIAKTL